MGRRRQYESDAERQRACRLRLEESTVRVDRGALDRLHARLDRLQAAVYKAAEAGDETARACLAGSVETVIDRLIHHFRGRAEAPK